MMQHYNDIEKTVQSRHIILVKGKKKKRKKYSPLSVTGFMYTEILDFILFIFYLYSFIKGT